MYEESMRMPLLIRYPKTIKAGIRTDAIVGNVDFAPTMLGFAGVQTPGYMQGRSFKTICETGKEPFGWPQEAYYRYWMHMAHHDNPGHVGIRTKEYKLIYYYGADYKGGNLTPPAWELYNMRSDPHESHNLYDDSRHAQTVASLKQRLATLRRRVGDDGFDFPETEKILQKFWEYGEGNRKQAIQISHEFLARRLESLKKPSKKPVPKKK